MQIAALLERSYEMWALTLAAEGAGDRPIDGGGVHGHTEPTRRLVPDWSAEILGESPDVIDDDWALVRDNFVDDEAQIFAVKACAKRRLDREPWIDQPCLVFLTDRAVYVAVRPQTFTESYEIAIPFDHILRCGAAPNDVGGTRLALIFEQELIPTRVVSVDLPRGSGGADFARAILSRVEPDSIG